MKPLHIIGAGGLSKQVIEIVEEINSVNIEYDLRGIVDEEDSLLGSINLGYKIVGDLEYLNILSLKEEVNAVIAIGNGIVREKIKRRLPNVKWITLIHPTAVVSEYSNIGDGVIIAAGVIINPLCKVNDFCILNIGCLLGHDVTLCPYTTLMPGCKLSGYVKVRDFSTLGIGSIVIQNNTIGLNSTVGAGAVVISDVEDDSTYVGIPAKKIK